MTSEAPILMPSPLDLVIEAVDDFAVNPSRSTLVAEVDKQTLIDAGLIIADPAQDDANAFEWIQKELGEGVVSRSAFYRWSKEFRHRYGRIASAHRLRVARWSVGSKIQNKDLREVIEAHMTRLVAEQVVDAADLASLEGKEQSTILAMLDGWTRADLKREEIRLKADEGERKAAKLEADLARREEELRRLRAENDEREQRRQAAANKAKAEVEKMASGASGASGGKGGITRESVLAMIDAVMKGEAA